jgi:hypothetical protein
VLKFRRVSTAIAAGMVLSVALAGCGTEGGAVVDLYSIGKPAFLDWSTDLPTTISSSTLDAMRAESKPALEEVLHKSGTIANKTSEDLKWENAARLQLRYWNMSDTVTGVAAGVNSGVARDAKTLAVRPRSVREANEWVPVVKRIRARILKGIACSAANQGLNGAEQQRTAVLRKTYIPSVGMTTQSITTYVRTQVNLTVAPNFQLYKHFDVNAFANAAIAKAQPYILVLNGVGDSRNWATTRAYVYYLKACVASK